MPFEKKHFASGFYAAHMIKMGNFNEWEWLTEWLSVSEKYDANYDVKGVEVMGGCLEEHLNFVYNVCESDVK